MEQGILNENSNDFNWKTKLEDVNGLFDETLTDKEVTWVKLQNRLRQKQGRIRVVWYWAAAAFLGIAILATLLTANENRVLVVENNAVPKPSLKAVIPQPSYSKNYAAKVIPSSSKVKNEMINPGIPGNIKNIPSNNMSKNVEPIITDFSVQKDIQLVSAISPLPVPEELVATSLAPVTKKEKLKVVHINELGDAIDETRNMVHATNYRPFQSRLINPEVFTNSSLSLSNTGFNILKTRNAPSN